MLLTPEQFGREHRLVNLSTRPSLTTLASAVVKAPIYHFTAQGDELGPTARDLVVNAIYAMDDDADIAVHHEEELHGLDLDGFRHRPERGGKLIKQFHRNARGFSRVWKLDRELSKKRPLIINHSLIPHIYQQKVARRETFRRAELLWWHAMWMNVSQLKTERTQIVVMDIPSTVKSKEFFIKQIKQPTNTDLLKLRTREEVQLLDLLSWFAGEDEHFLDNYLANAENAFLALKDDNRVIYLPVKALSEFKADEKRGVDAKADWLYDMVMLLVDSRPDSEVDDDPEYEKDVAQLQEEVKLQLDPVEAMDQAILPVADSLLASGAISKAQYENRVKAAQKYKRIPSPTGRGTLADTMKEAAEKDDSIKRTKIPKMKGLENEAYLDATVANLDRDYIENHLDVDLISHMMMLQKGGFAVTNVSKDEKRDAGSHTQVFKLQTQHVKGDLGTIAAEFPKVKADGTFQMAGVTYRMNKQRISAPVVKIGPAEVAMTSAMIKIFMTVGDRKVNDYPEWLISQTLLNEDKYKSVEMGGNHDSDFKKTLPRTFAVLAEKFKAIDTGEYQLNFTQANEPPKTLGQAGAFLGIQKDNSILFMSEDNLLYKREGRGNDTLIGDIESVLGLPKDKKPIEFAEFTNIKGKVVPVGVMLAYWMGIEKFFKYLGVKAIKHETNARVQTDNQMLRFSDAKVELVTKDATQDLLVNGFFYFKKSLKTLKYRDLNHQKNFTVLFTERGIGRSQELEYRLIEQFWVDPITERELARRKQPTEILPLIVYAANLLTHRQHVDESDGEYMITRGYSRLNDIFYKEMLKGVREFHRSNGVKRKLTINPKAVRMEILQDAGVSPVEQLNPMAVAGEMERVTYSGTGGRSNQSMVGRHRKFHKNDRGVFSEGYTDDGKAGTVLYLTANPNLASHYGSTDIDGPKELPNLFSNTAMVMPYLTKDDPKRANMSRIQLASWSNAQGYQVLPIRTGGELMMAHKAGRIFALVSEQEGKVTDVQEDHLTIQYKDGTVDKYPLGLEPGMAAGKVCPHFLVTDRKKGYKFGQGEVLAWDKYFFERDWYNPTQVSMYTGVGLITAMRETKDTYEDASMASVDAAKKLAADIIHIRDIAGKFDEQFDLKVKVGDHVESTDVIAHIAPPGVNIQEDRTSALDYYSKSAPTAKDTGKIVKMEVVYCGDPSTATEDIQKLIRKGDKQRKRRAEYMDEFPTGRLEEPTYIGKELVSEGTVLVRLYIQHLDVMNSGDKSSFGNALKTVPGKIYDTVYTTLNGIKVEAVTSYEGMLARVVTSPEGIGIGNMLVRQIGLNGAKLYRGK